MTALIIAAANDECAMVAALLGARAAVDTKQNNGCAFLRPIQRVVGGGRR